MDERIEKAITFLQNEYDKSSYFSLHPNMKFNRIEHSIRVANIGRAIAEREGLNITNLTLGCLLHDVAYGYAKDDMKDHINHGHYSAEIARPFLLELGISEKDVDDICYGIALHADKTSPITGAETPLATSICDADRIDQFDAYRIYDTLKMQQFDLMSLTEKKEFVEQMILTLINDRAESLSTHTANVMQSEKIDYQIEFYQKLMAQIRLSKIA